jgi:hypothetical protein
MNRSDEEMHSRDVGNGGIACEFSFFHYKPNPTIEKLTVEKRKAKGRKAKGRKAKGRKAKGRKAKGRKAKGAIELIDQLG